VTNAATDKSLSVPLMRFFREAWLGGTGTAYDDPRVNLLNADLTGLPPLNIYYGEHEILAGSVAELADRAKAAGVDTSVHEVPAGQHLFLLGAGRVPETDTAIAEMGRWLRTKLSLAALPTA
jgi:acetyl esterase/lipase